MKRQAQVAGLLIIVAAILSGGCGPKQMTPPRETNATFLAQKARESGGDFSKLSPADQKEVQSRTQGHGPAAIRSWAQHLAKP